MATVEVGARMRLAINISGIEVRDGVLPSMLRAHVREAGLSMSSIELELTESGLMLSDAVATQLLSDLREEGARVSVDDFGTGYSSLGRLQRLPVDVLKIDKAFVEDIATGARQGALVRAIIMMAHSLDLTVVAEGVENEVQRAFLERHSCDLYQGHLLSPPLSASKMEHTSRGRPARSDGNRERAHERRQTLTPSNPDDARAPSNSRLILRLARKL